MAVLGWCLDGHHPNCQIKIQYHDRVWVCTCTCHGEEAGHDA